MAAMIKLKLTSPAVDLAAVQNLPGLHGLTLDPKFGVIRLDPRKDEYVVRTNEVDNFASRQAESPEILGVYGDVRISTT